MKIVNKPFLKWAGGKRWLAKHEVFGQIGDYSRYVEPFLGGGAVFFANEPSKALLTDINEELINLYKVIRDKPSKLTKLMIGHHKSHSKEYYYAQRALVISDPLHRAARMLYLNRTCFNGLYRVNLKGQFNVPIGTKTSVITDEDDFGSLSRVLANATIEVSDFEATINGTGDGDFVFVDPPYTVAHNMNGFVKYNDHIFSWSDQVRLRDALVSARNRGAEIVVSNADHSSVRELYEGYGAIRSVPRRSVISGTNKGRSQTSEVLVVLT